MNRFTSIFLLSTLVSHASFSSEYDSINSLQTLFTTSYERIQLDSQRNSGRYITDSGSLLDAIKPPLTVQMQGILIQGKKIPIAFINDQSTLNTNKLDNNIQALPDATSTRSYSVPVRAKSQHIKLKPGQQWRESDKKVHDAFQISAAKQKTDGTPSHSRSE